ncbi:MAG: hypothetical protein H0U98_12685 [Alphaproteobacteria bacterium]|nr:hypothetical protein [Alphaproteobacteria bacterium]
MNFVRISKVDYALAIAAALHHEFKDAPRATKIVMGWTGANDRTVKNWFAGTHGPSGEHLIVLAHHSRAVMMTFHQIAKRSELSGSPRMKSIRGKLMEALDVIDRGNLFENHPSE